MNSQDFRNLQEAYLNVYEQEEALDEISIGMKRRAADASVDKVNKAGERFRSSTSVDVQPYLMKKKDKAEAQHLRLAKAAESYDLYDIILSHLLDEGYADTEEAAERIMVNMSEEWRESIVVEGYKEIDREKHGRMYDRYKKLGTAAMKDARETGEASGDNRFKMSKMMGVIDKSAENLRNKR
jgi:hypothetical protein